MPVDQHTLRNALKPLSGAEFQIGGCESLLSDVFSTVKEHVKVGVQWTAAKSGQGAVKALKAAGNTVVQTLGTRRMKISVIAMGLRKDETQIKETSTPSQTFLTKYTSTGDIEDLSSDLKYFLSILIGLQKYELNLEAVYKQELSLFKSFVNIKTTDDAIAMISKLDNLRYPVPDFLNHDDSMLKSQVMPGGKVIVFNQQTHTLAIDSEEINPKESNVSFAKEGLLSLLSNVNELVDRYKVLATANQKYGDYIHDFNTVVGKSFLHLESLKGSVSLNLIRDLESRLRGNPSVFSFYTGFLPKVTLYLDDYVEGVTTFLSKQLN